MLSSTRRVRETAMIGDDVAVTIVRRLWRAACLPVLMVLVILEPLVTFVLAGLALLGLLTTLFFYLVGPPEFPVWTMLALSLGFAIVLVPYHALIRLLSSI
jgi:hypothetical protein